MKTNQMNSCTNHTRIRGFRVPLVLAFVGIAIALAAESPDARAGILQLAEPLNYVDGSLHGRGTDDSYGDFSNWHGDFEFQGSQWTSDWTLDPDSVLDFGVLSNLLSVQVADGGAPNAQGDYAGAISRDFSLGPVRDWWTIAGTFTVGDVTEDYVATMGLADSDGNTARMGIKNGQFVMQFGDQPEVTAGRVDPHTPYTLVARIEYDKLVTIDGVEQTGEAMRVWVNETYRRLNEGLVDPLMSAESVTGMSSLGNSLSISARVSSAFAIDDANMLSWDDLFIGSDFQDVNGFRHDISPAGLHVQDGFFTWDVNADGLTVFYPRAETGYGDVTMTIDGNSVFVFDGGNVGGAAYELKRDGVKADGELTLTLSGLDPGRAPEGDPYVLKTYHHDSQAQHGPIDIYLNVDGAEQFVMTVDPSTSDDPAAHASIAFTALDRYASFRFVARNGDDVLLNGFELIPEPSSLITMAIGLLGLLTSGFRRRTISGF